MQANSLWIRLFSIPEAAIYLGRSTWSVRRLIWSGEFPSVRAWGLTLKWSQRLQPPRMQQG
jgi:hypothetical protein